MVSKRIEGVQEELAERVLASAVSIDGRKEWTCKFCSESNVWMRWQAVAARNGEWSTGSSTSRGEEDRRTKSLEAENKERKEGKESKEGKVVHPGEKVWK